MKIKMPLNPLDFVPSCLTRAKLISEKYHTKVSVPKKVQEEYGLLREMAEQFGNDATLPEKLWVQPEKCGEKFNTGYDMTNYFASLIEEGDLIPEAYDERRVV